MYFILLISLIILTIMFYFFSGKNIISPSFVTSGVFLMSTLALGLRLEQWNITISSSTLVIILLYLIIFMVGEMTCNLFFNKSSNKDLTNSATEYSVIKIKTSYTFFFILFGLLITFKYYSEIRSIAISSGYNGQSDLLIQYARFGMLQGGMSTSTFTSLGTLFLRSLSYIYLFVYIFNAMVEGKPALKKNAYMLLLPVIYLVQYSFSGSRGAYIEVFTYIIIIIAILLKKVSKRKIQINRKILKIILSLSLIFIIGFVYLGTLKGWKGTSILDIIAIYFGGSIGALNKYLSINSFSSISNFLGEETFIGIQSLLGRFFQNDSVSRVLPFVQVGYEGSMVNIYTSIRRYLADFGIAGVIVGAFTVSFSINFIYNFVRFRKKVDYWTIFYGINFMVIIYQSIDEQFFVTFLSVTQIFTIIFTFMLYKVLLDRKLKNEYLFINPNKPKNLEI